MPQAKSRLKAVTFRQIREWARQDRVQGLPPDGDRIQCYKLRLPVGGRQICFMRLVRGPVQGVVVVLAARAREANNGKLKPVPSFTRKEAPQLFMEANATMRRVHEREDEGGARQHAEPSSEPAVFGAKVVSAKKRPKRRSVRMRFRVVHAQVTG